MKQILPDSPQKGPSLLIPWSQPSILQNHESKFLLFESPGLWYSVTAALESKYTHISVWSARTQVKLVKYSNPSKKNFAFVEALFFHLCDNQCLLPHLALMEYIYMLPFHLFPYLIYLAASCSFCTSFFYCALKTCLSSLSISSAFFTLNKDLHFNLDY